MPMKMPSLKCSYSITKKRAKSKPQRHAFKVFRGATLSYSKVLRSLLRICFSNVDSGVISLDYRDGSRNGLSELSSSLKNPLQCFVMDSSLSAMKFSDTRKEGSIDEFKATFCSSSLLTDPPPLVEWRIVETSMEDGLLARAAVNRSERADYRFGGAKNYGQTESYTDINEESRICPDLDINELPDLTKNSFGSRHQDTTVNLGSLKEDDLYNSERNQINMPKTFDNDVYLSKDLDWTLSKENIKKRRSFGKGFPPPLACLSGNRSSVLLHEAASLQLQRIKGNGRFVLREVKTPPQVAFKPTRLHGRLILQLINKNNENSARKLSRDKVAPLEDRIISAAEIKAEKSNPKIFSRFEKTTILLKESVPVISSSRVLHNHLDQKRTYSINASNKQEAIRESSLHENALLITRKKLDNKETSEVSYALDAGLVRKNSFANSQIINTDVAADLVHSSREFHLKHDIIYYIIYCADFLDNRLPRKVSDHLNENSEVLNDPTQSFLRLLLFNLKDVMNGVDSASNLRCKGFERRKEDYIAARERRAVASS